MKNKKKIPVFDFKLGDKEKKFVNDCLETSSISQGSYVKNFEKKFSEFVNCKYGITTTSGTTALHLACKTLGIMFLSDCPDSIVLHVFRSPIHHIKHWSDSRRAEGVVLEENPTVDGEHLLWMHLDLSAVLTCLQTQIKLVQLCAEID